MKELFNFFGGGWFFDEIITKLHPSPRITTPAVFLSPHAVQLCFRPAQLKITLCEVKVAQCPKKERKKRI